MNHWQESLSLFLTALAVLYVTRRKVREVRTSRNSCDRCGIARGTDIPAGPPRER